MQERTRTLRKAILNMKESSAPGMDLWPVQCLREIPEQHLPLLVKIYDVFVRHAMWPTPLLVVRTQLIPKKEPSDGVLAVGDWRPLAISSVWVRAWGKWQLLLQHKAFANLGPDLLGGIPGRSAGTKMVQILLQLEKALQHDGEDEFHLLSLDAVKCFDKIDVQHALEEGAGSGSLRRP